MSLCKIIFLKLKTEPFRLENEKLASFSSINALKFPEEFFSLKNNYKATIRGICFKFEALVQVVRWTKYHSRGYNEEYPDWIVWRWNSWETSKERTWAKYYIYISLTAQGWIRKAERKTTNEIQNEAAPLPGWTTLPQEDIGSRSRNMLVALYFVR